MLLIVRMSKNVARYPNGLVLIVQVTNIDAIKHVRITEKCALMARHPKLVSILMVLEVYNRAQYAQAIK